MSRRSPSGLIDFAQPLPLSVTKNQERPTTSAAKRPLTAEVISDPSATGPRLTTPRLHHNRRKIAVTLPLPALVAQFVLAVSGPWIRLPLAKGAGMATIEIEHYLADPGDRVLAAHRC
jgi:hypothetical protein